MNTFIQQEHIQLIETDCKDINKLQNGCSFHVSFHQSITVSIKIFGSTAVFNIDNNNLKYFMSKSAYYYDF